VDVLRRGQHSLAETRARFALDALAQLDDALVERQRGVEPVDGGEVALEPALQRARERGLVALHDRSLQRERLPLAARRTPGPHRPIEARPADPVGVEAVAEQREPGAPVAEASERREPWQLARRRRALLAGEALARARVLA